MSRVDLSDWNDTGLVHSGLVSERPGQTEGALGRSASADPTCSPSAVLGRTAGRSTQPASTPERDLPAASRLQPTAKRAARSEPHDEQVQATPTSPEVHNGTPEVVYRDHEGSSIAVKSVADGPTAGRGPAAPTVPLACPLGRPVLSSSRRPDRRLRSRTAGVPWQGA